VRINCPNCTVEAPSDALARIPGVTGDVVNKTGPAGPELVRVRPDGSWDLIVGMARDTLARDRAWLTERNNKLLEAEAKLNNAFAKYLGN